MSESKNVLPVRKNKKRKISKINVNVGCNKKEAKLTAKLIVQIFFSFAKNPFYG
jgi:hypothetical protein